MVQSSGTIGQRNKISPQEAMLSSAIINQQQSIVLDRDGVRLNFFSF